MSFRLLASIILFSGITFLVYHLLLRFVSLRSGKLWLLLASLLFYAGFAPYAVILLIASAVCNYAAGMRLIRDTEKSHQVLLVAAIAGNILLLAFFKYAMALERVVVQLEPAFHPIPILLPLGLSFYTFSQLNFLMEASAGLISPGSFTDYLLFVSFFPYISSGPIVRYSEIAPQLQEKPEANRLGHDVCVGLTLIAIGFFKKAVLGDGLANYVQPIFNSAAHGAPTHLIEAWLGGISYVLELYFDFSGYSDMAIGAARLFGIRLPLNFNSPYKAENMSEFWTRWHMTLTRFLTSYVYNPMVHHLVRQRLQGKKRLEPWAAFWSTAALPVMFTMILIGLWHGTSATFLVFGILNGFYLVINHSWHLVKRRLPWILIFPLWLRKFTAHAITCAAILVGFICFNATSVSVLLNLLAGMIGAHGLTLPSVYEFRLRGLLHALPALHINFIPYFIVPLAGNLIWIGVLLVIVWFFPNSQEFLSLELPGENAATESMWKPSISVALGAGILCSIALWCAVTANHPMEFIYFNF